MTNNYKDTNVITLNWDEHIRIRPGMYIGKLGDGSAHDDGIYVLLKEVIDNSIDEFMEGFGKTIDISIKDHKVMVRDYGRGIPLKSVVDCVSKMNTGAKFKDSESFESSIGMNGVGVKAVNALSSYFKVQSFRDSHQKQAEFSCGKKIAESEIEGSLERSGTLTAFIPDDTIFENYHWYTDYIEKMVWNYVYLNRGLVINFNGKRFTSKNGLNDLLMNTVNPDEMLYQPIHLQEDTFEFALVHTKRHYGEEYYSFVNSQNTTQGGRTSRHFGKPLSRRYVIFTARILTRMTYGTPLRRRCPSKSRNRYLNLRRKRAWGRSICSRGDRRYGIISMMLLADY